MKKAKLSLDISVFVMLLKRRAVSDVLVVFWNKGFGPLVLVCLLFLPLNLISGVVMNVLLLVWFIVDVKVEGDSKTEWSLFKKKKEKKE